MNQIVTKDEFVLDEAEQFLDHLAYEMQKENRTSFNKNDTAKLKKWFLCVEFDVKQFENS